jgi:molecular chaperone IbpA
MNNLARWERYSPVGINLEDMFHRLDLMADNAESKYPSYNLIKLDEEKQQLQIALAGFKKDDIEVAVERQVLSVSVNKVADAVGEFVHRGIAQRTFARNWQLSEDTKIEDVTFIDGLLCVTLMKEIPEEAKRKVLPIS